MDQRTLVVLLHGYTSRPEKLVQVESAIRAAIDSVEVITPALPLSRLSIAKPGVIVTRLLWLVDEHWGTGHYNRIILVGHSAGALLARKLYIAACGNHQFAPLERELEHSCTSPRPWATHVERLVLLAGMNNGWSIDYHMSLSRALQYSVGVVFAQLVYLFAHRWPTILQIQRGAPFLTELRVQWILMRRDVAARGVGGALVVQLLGTVDDLVSPQDNMDLVTGSDFFFLDVPDSGHASVLEMDDSDSGQKRAGVLKNALTWSKDELRLESAPIEEVMFPFLSPWRRRQKVEWLMNKYAEAIARYPRARKFHYVGHSNGTYLLARALRDYRCCHFSRVVFAGSVVPSQYDWKSHLQSSPPRVEDILNYVATADWVVAFFPNCFEFLGISDIGGAGHRGFTQLDGAPGESQQPRNIRYVVGQHGAAIRENNWKALADFVVQGYPAQGLPSGTAPQKHRELFVALFGRCPPLIWLALLAVLASVPVLLVLGYAHYHWPEWVITSLLIAYGSSIWYVGNRV